MSKRSTQPITLTIAGSDSGGGAGIQADLKTFASLGTHGTSAITCLTAQNPQEVRAIQAAAPGLLRHQLDALLAELRPMAAKTGMLYSAALIRVVVDVWSRQRMPALIVDPVMVSTSGTRLLLPSSVRLIQKHLLPLATLVTPNLPEAEILLAHPIRNIEGLRTAAREIKERFGCAALVKGGHLHNCPQCIDFYHDGQQELFLSSPRIRGVSSHGTGCTYSAAITAYLALGCSLPLAVSRAKEYITQAIAQSLPTGRHHVLNWFWDAR